ncbi:hypothetical protein AUC69_13050 [Methyloceanibacter superfactus]|uniref:Uncharacterized protein n=1 Tax=Methyloceanibacter superfactus TaxID=1774969 RepID=A0A1E3VU42_9HYPH|nr:hypothetical protein AUC69_13050 [Methyloceanibacter superfactus]
MAPPLLPPQWRLAAGHRPGRVVEPGVVVETDDGDVVVVAPLRPASCGEFHYWNGVACVDARFNDPYIGPK